MTGKVKEKVLPCPGAPLLSSQMRPLCISTRCLTMDKTQPGAGGSQHEGMFAAVETIENARLQVERDADAAVLYVDLHLVAARVQG